MPTSTAVAYLISLNFPVSNIHFDFGGAGGDKPKSRRAFFAEFVFDQSLHLPFADQCSALHAETLEHHLGIVELGFRQTYLAVGESLSYLPARHIPSQRFASAGA